MEPSTSPTRSRRGGRLSPLELVEPVLAQLERAMTPENLNAQAQMSRSRFAISQCTTILSLLLVLFALAIFYGFIQVSELRELLHILLSLGENKTASTNL